MGKPNRSKESHNNYAKGNVTPIQVAFIVDRYLSDNFSETRSVFRNEASALISKSPLREAPKSLLSLMAMLNEYISLKEEKVMLDQEKARLEQEKMRVQTLLQGMQGVMNTYNASSSTPTIQPTKSMAVVHQPIPSSKSPSGCLVQYTPIVVPVSVLPNTNISPAITSFPLTRKRAGSKVVSEPPQPVKKSRNKLPNRILPDKDVRTATKSQNEVTSQDFVVESSPHNRAPNRSSVAKSLFNQPSLPTQTNSSGPETPPQPVSFQDDKSPLGNSFTFNGSTNNSPQGITPTNCTLISKERVAISPYKQMAFYKVERNHCISSSSPVKTNLKRLNMRDHVKGRLDFDGSDVAENMDKPITNEISTSESEKEADFFDMDLPNLDAFGPNFSFSELLVDLDLDCEGIGYPFQPNLDACASLDNISGSSHESGDAILGADQVVSEYSSTLTEMFSGKDMNVEGDLCHLAGSDNLTAVKSVTKCIRIISPVKGYRSSLD
ncbi:uncharacterized protein LOC123195207 [Mangifera indica]|uniref:uncharacterized protein LOC123195207 n=1 Tax=Mangifera indica TaxID=29780 RepID=UPI001CFA521B|nr:uncharacterized protein LOC123195207 [Mangifera indica]